MFTVIKMLHGCFVDYYPCKIHNNFQKGEVTYVNIKDRSNKEVVRFFSLSRSFRRYYRSDLFVSLVLEPLLLQTRQ